MSNTSVRESFPVRRIRPRSINMDSSSLKRPAPAGAPAPVLRVNDLDGPLKRLRAIGTKVVSAHGEAVDPNGVNLELYETRQ